MKSLLTAAALFLASVSAHAQFDPYATMRPEWNAQFRNQNPGYIVTCPVGDSRAYTYWFGFYRGDNSGRLAISRLGLPNRAQVFASLVDGDHPSRDVFDMLIRTEVGVQYHIKFNGKRGFIDDGQNEYRCTVAKTTFYS